MTAALSWQDSDRVSWVSYGLWRGSILIFLASIGLTTQQSVTLNRLRSYQDYCQRIRHMLGTVGQQTCTVNRLQLLIWEAPMMLLNFGATLFILGLAASLLSENMGSPRTIQNQVVRTSWQCLHLG